MMAEALVIWPMHVIEEALGDDADGILPQAIRSAELRGRLPRYHIDMLEYRADPAGDHRQWGCWRRELDGIASAHIRGDGVACRLMKTAYPQMPQIERRWRTVFICVLSASSADDPPDHPLERIRPC
jgi:hypothetical protein